MKESLVTTAQALVLRGLGFDEVCLHYVMYDEQTQMYTKTPRRCMVINAKTLNNLVPVPTVDEALDFMRRKYNLVTYGNEPTVDMISREILYSLSVKECNTIWGYNQRVYIGYTKRGSNYYAIKREALWMEIRYITAKKKKNAKVKTSNRSRHRQ